MSRYTKRELKWTRLKLENMTEYADMQEEAIDELVESLHIARKSRRDLLLYTKQLKGENERYEKALKECIEQDGLMEFLDKNDWATQEDYFVKIAKEALYK